MSGDGSPDPSDIADLKLAASGERRIEWAEQRMPVLAGMSRRFREEKPLTGLRVGACLHVTSEVANLLRVFKEGGASVAVCASSEGSTQDEVAAALVAEHGIRVYARFGEETEDYRHGLDAVLDTAANFLLDDGADLISRIHEKRQDLVAGVRGGTEQTTTGVSRLRAMAAAGELRFPVVAVNDSDTKKLFNNRYGTGQSTMDAIIRATNVLIAGQAVVVVGYGLVGRGIAGRATGLGANVIVVEVNAVRALEAQLDGCRVLSMAKAAKVGQIFITATGSKHVINKRHFNTMQDGAMICNCGHFDVELDLPSLRELAGEPREVRPLVEEFKLLDGRRLYLLGGGRLINFTAGEGHPAGVMDLSFSNQVLAVELLAKGGLEPGVHTLPADLDDKVAKLKLESLGLEIDEQTDEQREYLASWRDV